eukprot:scpid92943/ scgid5798/ 
MEADLFDFAFGTHGPLVALSCTWDIIMCEDKYYKHHCDPMIEHTKTNASVQEHPALRDNDYVFEARDTSDVNISQQDQNAIKILWDFSHFTVRPCDRFIEHRQPDIILVDGLAKKALIF